MVKEVRDRGMMWKNDQDGRRGYELVLWSTLDADNYNYMIAYHFRDDGSIGFRIAATAVNLQGAELTAHMHNGLWRVDVDLDGATGDTVGLHIHNETINGLVANDSQILFSNGTEGFADWNPLQFTMLNIADTKEKRPRQADQLRPDGPARRRPAAQGKLRPPRLLGHRAPPGRNPLPGDHPIHANKESIASCRPGALVHLADAPHAPQRRRPLRRQLLEGVAHAMWGGFDLRPRNLFDSTPFYP